MVSGFVGHFPLIHLCRRDRGVVVRRIGSADGTVVGLVRGGGERLDCLGLRRVLLVV